MQDVLIFFPRRIAEIPLAYALLHFVIVSASIAIQGSDTTAPLSEFNNVFNPLADSQQAFMNMVTNYPDFVAEGTFWIGDESKIRPWHA